MQMILSYASLTQNKSYSVLEIKNNYPLFHTQQDFWFLHQSSPESPAYNGAFAARVASPIAIDKFQQAWQMLASRHAILRTRFPLINGQPRQVIENDGDFVLDFSLVKNGRFTNNTLLETVTKHHESPFDLENGPLWRIRLFAVEDDFVLLFSFHHILIDFWSVMVLLTEFGDLYSALVANQPIPQLTSATPFTEYMAWHSDMLQSKVGENQQTYWQQQIAKAANGANLLQLPTDRPLPPIRTFNGDILATSLPSDLVTALNRLATEAKATLFATLLAAFQLLLHRYTAQEEIIVGVPMSGRLRAQFDQTIGCIANQTFILTEMAGNPSFRDLLAQVQQNFMAAMVHQEYPYRLMTQALPQSGDRSRPPLAQVIFNMPLSAKMKQFAPFFFPQAGDNGQTAPIALGELTLQPFFIKQQAGQFFLMVELWGDEDYTLLWRYNSDIFDQETIERLAGCYHTLLESILADPDQEIGRLPLLTASEQHQLLETWNATDQPVPSEKCIHHLFEEQVERTPNATALVSPLEEKCLSYRELNHRANQLAHYLQRLGVRPNVLVGICVERSLDMIIGLMGVLKAGAAYVPMDPNYPTDRLGFMLADSQAPILLTQEKFVTELPQHNAQVICLDRDWQTIAQEPATNPVSTVTPQNLVYCIFTSGSTGKPKGAQITHQNFVSNLYAYFDAYQVHDTITSTLQMASFSFDMFGADLQRTLWHGAKLVICPQEWLLDPEKLYQLMRREVVDFAQFVPAVLRTLVNYLEKSDQDLRFMRILNIGGDVWYMHEYERFKRFCSPTTRIVNSYGVTECTIDSSYFEYTNQHLPLEGIVPIGRPFANTKLYILDQHRQPLPIGVVGDLYISGANVGLGYLNRPELTAERFIPNPWSKNGSGYLYKTGDLARYLPDGNIDFLGRSDHQVKIRGNRVELGEIETALGKHPDVREAVIMAQDHGTGKRLVAYVVGQTTQIEVSTLRTWLEDQLPDYMVPTAFIHLDALPLTPNGKVNRGNLPLPDADHLVRSTPYAAPVTAQEQTLAEIWQAVLQVEKIGRHDNFFEVGGDSILAIQIISRARPAGLHFTVRHLFQARTIAQLVLLATSVEQNAPVQPTPSATCYPLAPMQAEMMAHLQANPDSNAYWLQFSCQLQGTLEVDAFKAAWQQVVARHPALRTTFVHTDEGIKQVVSPTLTLPWHEADWQALSADEQTTALATFLEEDMQRTSPFDQTALVRCGLMRCAADRCTFAISHHHLLTDGWSFSILLQEAISLYHAALREESVQLAEPRPYHAYIDWLQQDLRQAEQFWQETLQGRHTPTPLPPAAQAVSAKQYSSQSCDLSAELSSQLQKFARHNNLTLNSLVQGSVALLLSHLSGEQDVVYGVTFAGRPPELPAVDAIMGLLIHNLPLRVKIAETQMLLPWLTDLLQKQVDIEPYIYTPLQMIQQWCDHPQPLFYYTLRFQNFPMDEVLRHSWGGDLNIYNAAMVDWWHYPLNMVVTPGTRLNLTVSYDTHIVNAQTVQRLLAGFEQLLTSFVKKPYASLSEHLAVLV